MCNENQIICNLDIFSIYCTLNAKNKSNITYFHLIISNNMQCHVLDNYHIIFFSLTSFLWIWWKTAKKLRFEVSCNAFKRVEEFLLIISYQFYEEKLKLVDIYWKLHKYVIFIYRSPTKISIIKLLS